MSHPHRPLADGMQDAAAAQVAALALREREAMARALALASSATAVARPNPGVGCVILKDGRVVGEGSTQRVGGPHAEVMALRSAGAAARGATAVMTLEPCNHTGRTGPCSVALLDAGVRRVVHALADPGAAAAGGAASLRAAGVQVIGGLFAPWASEVHRAFLVSATRERPHLTLKVAMTADGAMARRDGAWVTGPMARARVHALRDLADGVLVGVGTVLADDPQLDVRALPPIGTQPVPIIVDSRLRTPPNARAVARGALVLTTNDASTDRASTLAAQGATILRVASGVDGRVDLNAAQVALYRHGLRQIFAEPGPELGRALLAAGWVDDVVLHVAPDVADDDRLPTVAPTLVHPLVHAVQRIRLLGKDLEVQVRVEDPLPPG
ncbi:MAG: diaminohydroxyphosphoribosylaminopyrimidine deaminase [Glaciecola sp.]|jgi:diaminohydroxyphosphoribosylaminopyrimidine deaminase/5-amino-6-(5-phosphoribosylamino)uracil reductase